MEDLNLSILREFQYNNQQISRLLEKFKIEVDIEIDSIFIMVPALAFTEIEDKIEKIKGLSSYYGTPKFFDILTIQKQNISQYPLQTATLIKKEWEKLKLIINRFQYLCQVELFVENQLSVEQS